LNDNIKEKNIINLIIKDDIFRLLENECKVLYYPIEDDVCAFYMRIETESGLEKFVFINTSMPYEKQIFAAAHELSHIWGISEDRQEVLYDSSMDGYIDTQKQYANTCKEKTELIANRFAAELLVVENILENELKRDKIKHSDDINIDIIIRLMDLFLVPYKTIIKRLYEIGKLSSNKYDELLEIPAHLEDSPIIQHQKRLGLCHRNNTVTKEKKFSNFLDIATKLYDKEVRTFTKLEYLLKIFDIKPQELGVSKRVMNYITDEELEVLINEEE